MGVNVTGKINFFVRFFGEGENRRQVFNTYIGRDFALPGQPKDQMNKSIDLTFDSKAFKPEDLAKLKEDVSYQMEFKGFITLKRFKRQGSDDWCTDFVLHVTEGHLLKKTIVDQEKKAKALEETRMKRGGVPNPESPIGIDPDLPF